LSYTPAKTHNLQASGSLCKRICARCADKLPSSRHKLCPHPEYPELRKLPHPAQKLLANPTPVTVRPATTSLYGTSSQPATLGAAYFCAT